MKFTFIANACAIIETAGTRILTDPWIKDSVFDGAWYHYPPLKTSPETLVDVDAIYVSHLHPDHFDERTFPMFDKGLPIIVLDHPPNYLHANLQRLGFLNLVAVKPGETAAVGDIDVTLYAPFAKNVFHEAAVGNLIDSACVFKGDGQTLLNTNDNRPTLEAASELSRRHGQFDLVLLTYNGAGPYPSCFDNLSEAEKLKEHKRIVARNLDAMCSLANAFDTRAVMPFAGAYVIGGRNWRKNDYLGTTTWDHAKSYLEEQACKCRVITMREGSTLSLDTLDMVGNNAVVNTADRARYIENTLSAMPYAYERDRKPDRSVLINDIECASIRMKERARKFGLSTGTNTYLSVDDTLVQILPAFKVCTRVEEPALRCSMDLRLLRRILDRKSHWNNAEIGTHITFYREPNLYQPDLHTMLQFFHL